MAKPLKVTHHHNRGDSKHPYGYVYFNDDTRVGFAVGTRNTQGHYGLFPGTWGGNTLTHINLAEKHLEAKYPQIKEKSSDATSGAA